MEAKRRKLNSKIIMVDSFNLTDVKFQPVIKRDKISIVPMEEKVLIQLSGGGMVPRTFGVEEKGEKIDVKMQISSQDDENFLNRIRDELLTAYLVLMTRWAVISIKCLVRFH